MTQCKRNEMGCQLLRVEALMDSFFFFFFLVTFLITFGFPGKFNRRRTLASVLFEQVYYSCALSKLPHGIGLEHEIKSIFLVWVSSWAMGVMTCSIRVG